MSFASAVSRLALDTDFAARSPFFKATINNISAEEREMRIGIEEFDPEAMDHVIKFMYGKIVEKGSFKFLFEEAQRFQMDDLKEKSTNPWRKPRGYRKKT